MTGSVFEAKRPRHDGIVNKVAHDFRWFHRAHVAFFLKMAAKLALILPAILGTRTYQPRRIGASLSLVLLLAPLCALLCAWLVAPLGRKRRAAITRLARDGELVTGNLVSYRHAWQASVTIGSAQRVFTIVQKDAKVTAGAVRVLVSEDEDLAIVITEDGAQLLARRSSRRPSRNPDPRGELAPMRVVLRDTRMHRETPDPVNRGAGPEPATALDDHARSA